MGQRIKRSFPLTPYSATRVFFIRLLNNADTLHENAKGYFRYFLQEKVSLKCSAITIAEYCVKGKLDELPLRNLQILPFNLDHAVRAGLLYSRFLENKPKEKARERDVVINDVKLFAQADIEEAIDAFITSDTEGKKIFETINKVNPMSLKFIDIQTPHNATFGILPLS